MKKATGIIAAALLAAACFAGGTTAYLTDYSSAVNVFTVGEIRIQETEPGFTPDEEGKIPDIQPEQTIPKDPTITNVGVNDAYVYMDVSIPIAKVVTVKEDGTRDHDGAAVDTELFRQNGLCLSQEDATDGWYLMYQRRVEDYMVYTYSYDQILHKGESTPPLFTSVTFANVVEGQLDGQTLKIPVRSYAIQTLNTGEEGDLTVREKARSAWEKYMNQNDGTDGEASARDH